MNISHVTRALDYIGPALYVPAATLKLASSGFEAILNQVLNLILPAKAAPDEKLTHKPEQTKTDSAPTQQEVKLDPQGSLPEEEIEQRMEGVKEEIRIRLQELKPEELTYERVSQIVTQVITEYFPELEQRIVVNLTPKQPAWPAHPQWQSSDPMPQDNPPVINLHIQLRPQNSNPVPMSEVVSKPMPPEVGELIADQTEGTQPKPSMIPVKPFVSARPGSHPKGFDTPSLEFMQVINKGKADLPIPKELNIPQTPEPGVEKAALVQTNKVPLQKAQDPVWIKLTNLLEHHQDHNYTTPQRELQVSLRETYITPVIQERPAVQIRQGLQTPLESRGPAPIQSSTLSRLGLRQTTPKPHPDQPEMIERIIKAARLTRLNGQTRLRVTLQPPQLGELRVELSIRMKVLSGVLQVENNSAREVVLANLASLRESLEAQGIRVGELTVAVRQGFEGSGLTFRDGNLEDTSGSFTPSEEAQRSPRGSEGKSPEANSAVSWSPARWVDIFA